MPVLPRPCSRRCNIIQSTAIEVTTMRALIIGLAVILLSPGLFGQSANIVGTIRDSSSAAVPGARITAVNVQTGLRQTRESSLDGTYSLPLLPVGQYRLEVEKE